MTREELDRAHEAVTVRHRRMLEDNFKAHLPVWLDELGAIAEQYARDLGDEHRGEHVPESVPPLTSMPLVVLETPPVAPAAPTDAEIEAWIERNPQALADWAAKQARVSGGTDIASVMGPGSGQGAPASKPPMTSLPPGRTTTPRRPAARKKAT